MFSTAILCLTSAFYLRMFARKSSNIDLFLIELLLQLGYVLLLSEMQKNWGSPTSFRR